jgi:hypothetical protein
MQMSGLIREQPASMAARQGPELNSRIYEQPSGSAGEQCWTEIFRLPGELRRGPGVRRCRRTPRHRRGEPARHPSRSRRRCAPDRSSINPAPDPVFADIENFRPRDRLRARDRSRTFGTAVNNAAALIGQVRSVLDKRVGAAVTIARVAGALRAVKSWSISSRIAFNWRCSNSVMRMPRHRSAARMSAA